MAASGFCLPCAAPFHLTENHVCKSSAASGEFCHPHKNGALVAGQSYLGAGGCNFVPLRASLQAVRQSSSHSFSNAHVNASSSSSSAHFSALEVVESTTATYETTSFSGDRVTSIWVSKQQQVHTRTSAAVCSLKEHGLLSKSWNLDARGGGVSSAVVNAGTLHQRCQEFEIGAEGDGDDEIESEDVENLHPPEEDGLALISFDDQPASIVDEILRGASDVGLGLELGRVWAGEEVTISESLLQQRAAGETKAGGAFVRSESDAANCLAEDVKVNGEFSSKMLHRTKEESKVVRTAWEKLVRWSRSWQLMNARRNNALVKTKKVVVLGGGSFGTAMAVLLARNKAEMNVTLLLRDERVCQAINDHHMNLKYFPRHQLPKNVAATTNAREALKDAQYCVHAVPVQSSSAFLRSIAEHVPATLPFLSVSKGLELSTLEMMSQVIPRALGNPRQPVAVISGPSFAIELMDELPTAMVAASRDKELARAAQQLLASRYLRVNTSNDVVGVEMAGALKNVLAIAAGIVEGMQLGNNCMAALVAQGCSEIRWLAEKMGAKSTTMSGLSGSGDIMLTCFVSLSRNRSVGVRLGSGEKLEDILSSMNQVAEGVATAGAVISLAKKYRVQMPVLTAVARILDNELTPKTAVLALMSLPQVEEV